MTIQIGAIAPDFEAETTEGLIHFHDWIGDSSNPKDFTPIRTTELGFMARINREFDHRWVKALGLSCDPVDRHEAWAADVSGELSAPKPYIRIVPQPKAAS